MKNPNCKNVLKSAKSKALFIVSAYFTVLLNFSIAQIPTKQITLEDIWLKGTFRADFAANPYHMNDGLHYCLLDDDSLINLYAYKTGSYAKTLLNINQSVKDEKGNPLNFEDFEFSPDESKILFTTESEPLYRHSSKSAFYVYDFKSNKTIPLSVNGKQMHASFSPDGQKIAFVRDNNLFYKDLRTDKEIQITKDGLFNHIINGMCDWVYEEEFSFSKAFFWSPNSQSIAFYRFDESNVKEFTMPIYGNLYPEQYTFKYPKAGEDNSKVSIHVFDINKETIINADLGVEKDQYIPRVVWTKNPEKLAIQRLNRLQNKLEILICDIATGKTKVLYTEENKYYIDITDNLKFLNDGKHFIFSNERSGWHHLYLYNIDGSLKHAITEGNYDVLDLIAIDEKNTTIYYTSSEQSPIDKPIYAINYLTKQKKLITPASGHFSADFSKNFNYYLLQSSDANTPTKVLLYDKSGKLIKVIVDNAKLQITMQKYGVLKKEFFTFKTSEGIELNGWKILPANFDENKKYPVLLYFYGGPNSQTVQNAWSRSDFFWFQLLAQKGYMIISVDGRGTGARGEEFRKCTYLQLGKYELLDQIETAKYLATLPYVDAKRIGVFGWSFGGYLASLCMTKGADYFKAGIAVAPVINWRYYDNIYTERFMRTPKENPSGYDDNSPIFFAQKMKGSYLLIHGTADDNVHAQNSFEMADALVKNNIPFEMQFYTNKNHGIYGGKTRLHLYTKMTDFILKNL